MDTHMKYKQPYILGPFLEVHSYLSFQNLLITNPSIISVQIPEYSTKPLASIHELIHNSYYLSFQTNKNQLYYPNYCPWEEFFLPHYILQVCPSEGLYCCSRSLVQRNIMRQSHLQSRTELYWTWFFIS